MGRKKWVKPLIIVAAAVLVFFGLCFAVSRLNMHEAALEANWGLSLPGNMKEVYYSQSEQGFQGDGYRYTVFQLNDANTPFLKGASNQKSSDVEDKVTQIIIETEAAKAQYPNFSHHYLWKTISKYDDTLYIIFDPEKSLVFFVEKLI
ncbi:MAG TPA: hypothetical protein VHP31_09840 [Caproicibacter sp.]|nr:hypothetical protein [Caproicibacter sp.]